MKPTVEQLKKKFEGKEPDRGGYGSQFTFEEHEDGVEVTFEAEWLPRYLELTVVVTDLDGSTLTYHRVDRGEKCEEETETVDHFCEERCGEFGC